MELNVNEIRLLETAAARAEGPQPWFIHAEDLLGDLNKKDFRIIGKNGNLLFMITQGSLEYASYICSLNNTYNRMAKDSRQNADYY